MWPSAILATAIKPHKLIKLKSSIALKAAVQEGEILINQPLIAELAS